MTDCPYCGKEIGENESYCMHCENDLSEIIDKEAKEQHEAIAKPIKDFWGKIKQFVKSRKK